LPLLGLLLFPLLLLGVAARHQSHFIVVVVFKEAKAALVVALGIETIILSLREIHTLLLLVAVAHVLLAAVGAELIHSLLMDVLLRVLVVTAEYQLVAS
jgi:hypothetical protein